MSLCLTLVSALAVAGCSSPSPLIRLGDPAVEGMEVHEIFVATNRARSDDPAELFGGERSSSLDFARVRVSVPPDHRIGRIESAPGGQADPQRDFTIFAPEIFASEAGFRRAVGRSVAQRPPGDRHILLFVHGYNTSFTSAVLQAAQFVEDSGYRGTPVLFTWPSRGETFSYVYDLNSALASRRALAETAAMLVFDVPAIEGWDLVAHSMGNILTVEALRNAVLAHGTFNRSGKLRSIVLASPDIDIDLFRAQIESLPPELRRFYVFVSSDDRALAASRFVGGGINRVGNADPEVLVELGVVVIDLSALKAGDSYHHGKFADAPDAVRLIGNTILAGGRLEPTTARSLDEFITLRVLD